MYFRRPQFSQRADLPEKPTAGTVVNDLKNCRRCVSWAQQALPPSQSAKGQCTRKPKNIGAFLARQGEALNSSLAHLALLLWKKN